MKVFFFCSSSKWNPVLCLGICLTLVMMSCAPSRYVRPLDKGEVALNVHAFGPLIKFGGAVVPVPLTSVGVGYGLRNNLTLHGTVHTTAALYGTIQTELGATYSPLKPKKFIPGISVAPMINLSGDIHAGNFKVWPQLDINAYWEYGKVRASKQIKTAADSVNANLKPSYFYVGLNNFFELSSLRVHDEPQPQNWIPSPHIGHVLAYGKWDFVTEVKFLAVNVSNQDLVVDYIGPGKRGAIGVYLGFNKRF